MNTFYGKSVNTMTFGELTLLSVDIQLMSFDLVGNIPSEEAFALLSTQQSSELKHNINWSQLKHQAFEVYAGNDN